MKKIILLLFLVYFGNSYLFSQNYPRYSNADANRVGVGSVLIIAGDALIRSGSNNYYYNPLLNPVSHILYLASNGRHYCHSSCHGTGTHNYFSPIMSHTRYRGNDGYYYCYDNCPGSGDHMRVWRDEIPQEENVYDRARDPGYSRSYKESQWQYDNRLYNESLRSGTYQPLRSRIIIIGG